jgi:ubiquinone/menaquinone biosynthesis C-methylase UbiE
MNNHSYIKECPITGHDEQIPYFSLGNIPLVNNLYNTRDEAINAERFPLTINYYPSSGESSLDFAVDSEMLFKHYLFKSEINIPYIDHCKEMFRFIQNYVKITNTTKIVDIGGNDGTLLAAFKETTKKKITLLNIDPSENLAPLSQAKGVPTLTTFFTANVASTLPKVNIITSTNVFQHLKDINGFASGVNNMLNKNGVWVLEFPYWIHDMETNQFDQIYHEHVYYHSVTPMKIMMEKHGMKLINVTKQNIHGGTLRMVIAKKQSKLSPDDTVETYLQLEKNYDLDYHIMWGKEVKNHIQKSKESRQNYLWIWSSSKRLYLSKCYGCYKRTNRLYH